MKDWQDFPDDDELGRADDLLGQADALLRRHRGEAPPSSARTPPQGSPGPAEPADAVPPLSAAAAQAFDDDDLPILTEVVEDLDLPAEIFQPLEAPFSAAAAASAAAMSSFVRTGAPGDLASAPAFASSRELASPQESAAAQEALAPPEPVAQAPFHIQPAALVRSRIAVAPEPPSQPMAPTAEPAVPASPSAPSAAVAEQQLAERLVELDTAIAREIDEWAVRELPQIIARELDRLGERIQDEALAHLRATLLPEISARVSGLFEDRNPDEPPAR